MSLEYNLIHRVNMGDILKRSAKKFPHKLALVEGQRRVTYMELNKMVNKVARGFQSIGLEKGDRLALLSSNSIEFLQTYFACAKAGITIVPINTVLLANEIEYILRDSQTKCIVAEISFLQQLQGIEAIETLKDIIVIGDESSQLPLNFSTQRIRSWDEFWHNQDDSEIFCEINDRDLMQCLYTSGTTSNPKGVMSSHTAVYFNTLGTAYDLKFTEQDVSIAMLPLYHVAQLNAITTPVILAGGTTVILKKFEPEYLMELIEKEKATQIFGLPMMYRTLIEHPKREEFDLSTLRLCVYAMAPMPDYELKRAHDVFKCDFALLFGQTEMAPVATVFRPEHQLIKPGAVGTPAVNVEVAIMDENGDILPEGEIGEIVYRSPQTMEGYLNDSEKTEEAFRYGWFHSGDFGYFDEDQMLWFADRKKDMVKTGGVNVSSIEVEKTIFLHPNVANVAIVGLPHEHWTEALTAFVISKNNEEIQQEEIIELCKTQLGGFKVPKKVMTLREFPMTSSGKIQKHILRTNYQRIYENERIKK